MDETRDAAGGRTRAPIFVWTTPRSLSTAFERCFKDRPDVAICHEPFAECYHYGPDRRSARYGDLPDAAEHSAASTRARLAAQERESEQLLIKDLAFQALPYATDEDLGRWRNAVLVRHPASVARSLAPLKPDFTEEELGFTTIAGLLDRIEAPLVVMDGDRFSRAPEETLAAFCEAVSLSYLPGFTSWDDGRVKEWDETEREAHAKWHARLESSRAVEPSPPPPPIEELAALGLSKAQLDAVMRAQPVYEAVMERALP